MAFLVLFLTLWIHEDIFCQKILLLEKPGTVNNYKYRINETIYLRSCKSTQIILGRISKLTDSSLIVNYTEEVKFNDITNVYRPMWINNWVPSLIIKGSIGYLLVVPINNVLQKTFPVFTPDMLIPAGLLGAGFFLKRHLVKNYRLTGNWRIRLIDFDKLNEININYGNH